MFEWLRRLLVTPESSIVADWCTLHGRANCEHKGTHDPRTVIGIYFGRTYYADGTHVPSILPIRWEADRGHPG